MIRTGIFTGRQSPPHFRVSLDKDDAMRTVAYKSVETPVETFCAPYGTLVDAVSGKILSRAAVAFIQSVREIPL